MSIEILIGVGIGFLFTSVGFLIGVVAGVLGARSWYEKKSPRFVEKIVRKIDSAARGTAVYVPQMTPEDKTKLDQEEKGWGGFMRGMKGPAEGVEDK